MIKKDLALSEGDLFVWSEPAMDYLSLAWWNAEYNLWQYLHKTSREYGVEQDARRMQYDGVLYSAKDGTIFLGSGYQRSRVHNLMQVSGALSQRLYEKGVFRYARIENQLARVTRIDLQFTIKDNERKINLKEVFDSLPEKLTKSIIKSNSITVYVYARTGDRFVRIYEKFSNNDRFVRFEVEYKHRKSEPVYGALYDAETTPCAIANVLMVEIQKLNVKGLLNPIESELSKWVESPKRIRARSTARNDDKTEKWLMETVFPSFVKFLSSSPRSAIVAGAYQQMLDSYYEGRNV